MIEFTAMATLRAVGGLLRRQPALAWLTTLSLALLVWCGGPRPLAAGPSVADLFQQYIRNPAATAPQLAAVQDLDAARADLEHLTPKFLSAPIPPRAAGPPASGPTVPILEQRRRDVVVFALDLAGANALRHAPASRRLAEWGCFSVRRHLPPNDFDHRWQMAALALIEGEIDPDALRAHLDHLEAQFPKDPRAQFAYALAAEQATAPVEVAAANDQAAAAFARARNPAGTPRAALLDRAVKSFQDLVAIDALKPEASLRLAHLQIELTHDTDALAALDVVDRSTDEPYTLYLSRLFRGQALEGLGRTADAEASYRAALTIGPNAHAATMALATSLFRRGQRDEAINLTDALVAHDDPTHDAWWSYWAGDYHLWGLLMARLRADVK